jgi:D-alanyl-D-alanine carboxypeptidase
LIMRHMFFLRSLFVGVVLWAAGPANAGPSLVFDVKTGQVLAYEDAFQRWYPASLTKLMTAYVAFRAVQAGEVELTSPITVSKHSASQPPSKMGYKPGQIIALDDALKMMIVKSANDIAAAIGENVGGSEQAFAARMNAEAQRLGMSGSHFVNANGLHDVGQYTTARDLAILSRAIRTEFPQHAPYFTIEALGLGKQVIKSHVDMLGRFGGADGMKTGFICPSGFNLVASATRGGRTLIAVVLGARTPRLRAEKAADLLGNGFDKPSPAATTLAALQLYGEGRDAVTDMRSAVCDRPAKPEPRDAKGKPVFHSPYLHERFHPPRVVALGSVGATGKVPLAFAAAIAAGEEPDVGGIPIPTPRPDYTASVTPPESPSTVRPAAKTSQVGG